MPAGTSHRRALLCLSALAYGAAFLAFALVANPALGIAHFFYIAIALLALATGTWAGAAGGVVAAGLYVSAILLNSNIPPAEILTVSTGVRLLTYTGIGALIGWFASSNRKLVGQLQILAERDSLTGLPNTRHFEAAITKWFDAGDPFALLVGDVDKIGAANGGGEPDRVGSLQRIAEQLGNCLEPDADIARVGNDQFTVLTGCRTNDEAARLAGRLESVVGRATAQMTFGWAFFPRDGVNPLSLYRAADERLYARKLFRTSDARNLVHVP